MKTLLAKASVVVGLALAIAAQPAAAAYVTFFGEDLNNSEATPLAATPSSNASESLFLGSLVGVGTETFESQTTGAGAPLPLTFPGAGTATLTGAVGNGSVFAVTPGTTNGFGRYSVPSASSSKFWEVDAGPSGNFVVTFSGPVAAFGFYGIDIGDFGGQLTLVLSNGTNFVVPNTSGSNASTGGSVLFFGIIGQNPLDVFTSVQFNTTTGQGDIFAFDRMTIGSLEQVRLPEPGSLALLAVALAGFAALRRKNAAYAQLLAASRTTAASGPPFCFRRTTGIGASCVGVGNLSAIGSS